MRLKSLFLVCFFNLGSQYNCSERLADKKCADCLGEEIQLDLNAGRCNQAKNKSVPRYPELGAIGDLCMGAPSAKCLLGLDDLDGGSFLIAATKCASGGSDYLVSAIESKRLAEPNEALALIFLFIESLAKAPAGCRDQVPGGCPDLGGDAQFTSEYFDQLSSLLDRGFVSDSTKKSLERCGGRRCESFADYLGKL